MKTSPKKFLSVFLSLLMTFMCLNIPFANAVVLPEKVNSSARMMLYFKVLEASPGQDIQMDMYASNTIAVKSIENLRLIIPDGFEVTGMDTTSSAFNGTVDYTLNDNYLNFNITSNGTLSGDEKVTSVYMHVSENCTAGKHDFNWSTSYLDCTTADGKNYTPTLIFGRVTVGESAGTTTVATTTQPTVTTQTITTETTTTTTTTTTVSAYVEVTINSYPTKTAYTVGEELDLSGGMFQSQGMRSDGVRFGNSPSKMENSANVDTSEFDSTKAGTYKIYIRVSDYGMTTETFFEVTVSEPETTTTEATTTTTTTTTTTMASARIDAYIVSYPTKTAYTIGEELDLSGGYFGYKVLTDYGVLFESDSVPMESSSYVNTSKFDNTKAGTYKIYILPRYSYPAELYSSAIFFEVTVSEHEIDTTTTATTTSTTKTTQSTITQTFTTTTTTAAPPDISIYSYPTKTSYTIGEELDLSGGMVEVQPSKSIANTIVYSMSEPNDILVDTSEFNNTKTGTYRIYVRFSNWHGTAETFFEVTVSEPETPKYTYSVYFVDEETNQAVSGVRYNIVSYDFAHDLAIPVQTSGENSKSYEFISDTVYVSLSSTEQAIPDGYYVADGAERWELSADNPNLTVYLRKSETTTTETTTSKTTLTTTTTTNPNIAESKLTITINSYPFKTEYAIGEELDLSGGTFSYDYEKLYKNNAGGNLHSITFNMNNGLHKDNGIDMHNKIYINTSEFDSTKAGIYKIYVQVSYDGVYSEEYFEVTVNEYATTSTTASTENNTETTTCLVNAIPEIYITYPTKTTYAIGENLDLSGGKIAGFFNPVYKEIYIIGENVYENFLSGKTIPLQSEMTEENMDTSEFDNTKAGDYKIYFRTSYEDAYAEEYFIVTVSESNTSLGDIDGDGMVNAVDATAILAEYALLSTGKTGTFNDIQNKSADVDGDGMINAVDATFVLSYYAFLSTGGNTDMATWLTTQS